MNQRYGKWKWVNNENKCEFIISITDKDISVSGVEREENEKFEISRIRRRKGVIEFDSYLPSTNYLAHNLVYIDDQGKITLDTLPDADLLDAQNGDDQAQYYVGNFYYLFCGGCKENFKIAFSWFLKSAQKGNNLSQARIGWMFWTGEGVKKSYKESAFWYTKSAMQGNPYAQYNLSLCYYWGKGKQKDEKKTFYWVKKAALSDEKNSMLALGWHYHNGIGVKKNLKLAKFWYLKSAKNIEPKAMFNLGQISYDNKEFNSAKDWFFKAINYNHPLSYYYLGRMYLDGDGFVPDIRIASLYFEKAMNLGVNRAKRILKSKKFLQRCNKHNKT